jgi:hypothetical protein
MSTASLVDSLTQLRNSLGQARLPIALPGSAEADKSAREMVAQLDDYILPRLATLDAPLLAVIGGSTGAGKSTLVNSLIGRMVSRPGVIRPTTRSPVLVHNPADLDFFKSDRVLPGLARSFQHANDTSTLQLVAEPSLPEGLALLDAPDVDSVVSENRALASQLLAAADLWLFVTTAARYADAVPWEYLQAAAERSAAVAVVLQRVPPAAMHDVPAHLGRLMMERGLGNSPLFAVPETTTDAAGLLPDAAVAPIRDWLATLAADKQSRQAVVMQTLDGAIGSLATRTPAVVAALLGQAEAADLLWSDAQKSYAEASRTIAVQTADGTLLRGEVLSRWQDFVGTGEFMRGVEQKIGWLRDRIFAVIRGEAQKAEDAKVAVQSGLEILLREEGDAAAERVENAWMSNPAGRQVLQRTRADLSRASVNIPSVVAKVIRDWQGDVLDLVSVEGADKKTGARIMAFGVNGVGLALMMIVFLNTGGITGAEVGIAGGTVVLAQRFLEAIFGEDGVRRMAQTAKQALDARVEALMTSELDRYRVALDAVGIDPTRSDQLSAALVALRTERADGPALDAAPRRALDATMPGIDGPAAVPALAPVAEPAATASPTMAEIFARAQADQGAVAAVLPSEPVPAPLSGTPGEAAGTSGLSDVVPRLGAGGIILPTGFGEPARGFATPSADPVEGTVLDADDPTGVRVDRADG